MMTDQGESTNYKNNKSEKHFTSKTSNNVVIPIKSKDSRSENLNVSYCHKKRWKFF